MCRSEEVRKGPSLFLKMSRKESEESSNAPSVVRRKCDERFSGGSWPEEPPTKAEKQTPEELSNNENDSNVWIVINKTRRNTVVIVVIDTLHLFSKIADNLIKDVGVTVTRTLSWDQHVHTIVSEANRLLWLLKRTCPLLTDLSVRRTLYLALVKSQLSYATQVWSPSQISLKTEIERVQRRATRWILQTRVGEMSYKDRLLALNLLPLTFDCELKDMVFFYKCLNNLTDLNVKDFVAFVFHGLTRLSSFYSLKSPLCKTSTYQSSYFNQIGKLWNYMCQLSPPSNFSTPESHKNFMSHLMHLLRTSFDADYTCTWTLIRTCPFHR